MLPTRPYAPDEPRQLRMQRMPEISPALHTLLYSYAGRNESPPAKDTHITPPKLARARDIVKTVPGKTLKTSRIAKYRWHWIAQQSKRINPPLAYVVSEGQNYDHAAVPEATSKRAARARIIGPSDPESNHMGIIQHLEALARTKHALTQNHVGTSTATQAPRKSTPPYIASAQRDMLHWCTFQPHERVHLAHWSRKPLNYAQRKRSRRRKYAKLLANAPILTLTTDVPLRYSSSKRLPGTLRSLRELGGAAAKYAHSAKATISPLALVRDAPPPAEAKATPEELEMLALDK
ncbi:hypothetical protein MCUN1_003616 [Malassezia cuniculi]|uniref:Uncharacterized protein n=1 Tax=Malassezia cuniculi TaxID=948313 RepID=A0AAF0EX20_9BASI|nr:hypothetical protein MCUN1_003616 [Malassezia cuniculi]